MLTGIKGINNANKMIEIDFSGRITDIIMLHVLPPIKFIGYYKNNPDNVVKVVARYVLSVRLT